MYKIVNNNISITRGETATYNVKVIDKTTGAPFILPKLSKAIISFGVRRSDYIKDGFAIKKYLWLCGLNEDITNKPEQLDCEDIIKLDTTIIYEYNSKDTAWSADYNFIGADGLKQPNDIKALFKYKLSDGTWQYKANIPTLDAGGAYKPNWVDYSFTIKFPFLYTDTSTLSPKSYKYSMTIYGGNELTIEDGKIKEDTISYKKPLVDANFIVEADINE